MLNEKKKKKKKKATTKKQTKNNNKKTCRLAYMGSESPDQSGNLRSVISVFTDC